MAIVWEALTVDARDPESLARWWARTLGWELMEPVPGGVEVRSPRGLAPSLFFVRGDETKTTNRLHLDLSPTTRARPWPISSRGAPPVPTSVRRSTPTGSCCATRRATSSAFWNPGRSRSPRAARFPNLLVVYGVAHVRTARDDDAEPVFALACVLARTFSPRRDAFDATFEQVTGSSDADLLVAVLDDRVVGYLLGFRHPAFFANGTVGWVEELVVREDLAQGFHR